MLKKRGMIIILITVVAILLFSINCEKDTEKEGTAIARVDNSTLTVDELLTMIPPRMLMNTSRQQRSQIIESWVNDELLYQNALDKGYQDLPEVEQRLEQIKKQLVTRAYIQEKLSGSSFVSDSEARQYFEEHKDDYNSIIEVSHISLGSESQAKNIRNRIMQGENFSSLARQYSTDSTTREKGGYFGSFRRGDFRGLPNFEKEAFELEKPGDISPVVQTEFGFDIIKLHSRKKGSQQAKYEDVAQSIKMLLGQQKNQAMFQSLMDSLKNVYTVETYPERLEKELGATSPSQSPSIPMSPPETEEE